MKLTRSIHDIKSRNAHRDLYLVSEYLRPGDVLLTQGITFKSTMIADATKGPFSHAAIVDSRYSVIESLGDGIGHSFLETGRFEKRSHGRNSRMIRLSNTSKAVLLRHPEFVSTSTKLETELMNVINSASQPYIGMHYPHVLKLATALPDQNPIKILYEKYRKIRNNRAPPPDFESPFCSALIVLIFQALQLKLFKKQAKHDAVSPNRLWHDSVLVPISGAITYADDSDGEPKRVRQWNTQFAIVPTRKDEIRAHRQALAAIQSIEQFLKDLEESEKETAKLVKKIQEII